MSWRRNLIQMLIKAGVDISRLRPEIRKKLTVLSYALEKYGDMELVITSTYESNHSPGSLHYANLAIDIRKPESNTLISNKIQEILGDDFNVISHKHHIHIEYNPK